MFHILRGDNMYDDILGKVNSIREIKKRQFNINNQEKEEDLELGLFEDIELEMEEIVE